MSTHAGNQSISSKRTMSLLKRLEMWLQTFIGIFNNLVVTGSASGTVVAAGGALAPTISAYQTKGGGTGLLISACASGSFTPGVVTPIVSTGPHGGALTVVYRFNQSADADMEIAMNNLRQALVAGPPASFDIAFTTTAGDASVTLGHGAGGTSSILSVQERPS